MSSYPVTRIIRNGLNQFPYLAKMIVQPDGNRSEKEIFRLLGNTHYGHINQLLQFLDQHISSTGEIGKRLLEQTDFFQFSQALVEFFLFVHLQSCPELHVKAAKPNQPSDKCHDMEFHAEHLFVKLEVYCPIDVYGFQHFEKNVRDVFRYLDVDIGFVLDLNVKLETSSGPFYTYDFSNEHAWLKSIEEEAKSWISSARVHDDHIFKHPEKGLQVCITLKHVCSDPSKRLISISWPTQSSDSRLTFELGEPADTASSQWGRKVFKKLKKRQCGNPDSDCLRVLVIDFSFADTGWPDFICWPKIAERLKQSMEMLVVEVGPPLAYDAVLPARLQFESCFSDVICLDQNRADEIVDIVKIAQLTRPCVDTSNSEANDSISFIENLLD